MTQATLTRDGVTITTDDGETYTIGHHGATVGILDERTAYRILTDSCKLRGTAAIRLIQDIDLEYARVTGAPFVVYDYATDIDKSAPAPYEKAAADLERYLRENGDDGSVRLAPWNDKLPAYPYEED